MRRTLLMIQRIGEQLQISIDKFEGRITAAEVAGQNKLKSREEIRTLEAWSRSLEMRERNLSSSRTATTQGED